jgi:hypothetical protein
VRPLKEIQTAHPVLKDAAEKKLRSREIADGQIGLDPMAIKNLGDDHNSLKKGDAIMGYLYFLQKKWRPV